MVKPLVPPMVDILGPYTATPQHVTSRPGKTGDDAGAGFSWWQDCTDENAEDGTPIPAVALNNFKAQALSLAQSAGVPINDDDYMTTRSIRRGTLNSAVAGGTASGLTVTLTPAPIAGEITAGFRLTLFLAFWNAAGANLLVNGGAATPIVIPGGGAIGFGDLLGVSELVFDGTSWVLLSPVAFATITTALSFTVYGTTPDFATLREAFAWLSRRRIAVTGSVTFNCRAGQYTHNGSGASIDFYHPAGARVSVVGANLVGSFPANAAFAAAGSSSGTRAANTTANLALLRSVLQTEIRLTGGATATFRGDIGGVSKILFTGDLTAVDGPSFINGSGTLLELAAVSFGNRGVVISGGGGWGYNKIVGIGCNGPGVFMDGVSFAVTGLVAGYNNGSVGVSMSSVKGSNSAGFICGNGNASDGVLATFSNAICGAGSTANNNGGHAFHGVGGGTNLDAAACTASGNAAGVAFYAEKGAYVDAQNSAGSGNSGAYFASKGSTVDSTGGGATGTTVYSPALNTIGNGNSIVIG